MRLLADENIPSSIVAWLRAQGYEMQTVADTNLKGRSDRDLLIWASKNNAVIVSLDQDFVAMWRRSKSDERPGAIVIKTHPPTPKRIEHLLETLFSKVRIDKHARDLIVVSEEEIKIVAH